jgi:hypothetical protein
LKKKEGKENFHALRSALTEVNKNMILTGL